MAIALHLDLKCIDVDTLIVKIFPRQKLKFSELHKLLKTRT